MGFFALCNRSNDPKNAGQSYAFPLLGRRFCGHLICRGVGEPCLGILRAVSFPPHRQPVSSAHTLASWRYPRVDQCPNRILSFRLAHTPVPSPCYGNHSNNRCTSPKQEKSTVAVSSFLTDCHNLSSFDFIHHFFCRARRIYSRRSFIRRGLSAILRRKIVILIGSVSG